MSKRKYARAIPALVLMLGLSLAGGAASADESVVPAEGAVVAPTEEALVTITPGPAPVPAPEVKTDPVVVVEPFVADPPASEPTSAPVVEEVPAAAVPAEVPAPDTAASAPEAAPVESAPQLLTAPASAETFEVQVDPLPPIDEAPVVCNAYVSLPGIPWQEGNQVFVPEGQVDPGFRWSSQFGGDLTPGTVSAITAEYPVHGVIARVLAGYCFEDGTNTERIWHFYYNPDYALIDVVPTGPVRTGNVMSDPGQEGLIYTDWDGNVLTSETLIIGEEPRCYYVEPEEGYNIPNPQQYFGIWCFSYIEQPGVPPTVVVPIAPGRLDNTLVLQPQANQYYTISNEVVTGIIAIDPVYTAEKPLLICTNLVDPKGTQFPKDAKTCWSYEYIGDPIIEPVPPVEPAPKPDPVVEPSPTAPPVVDSVKKPDNKKVIVTVKRSGTNQQSSLPETGSADALPLSLAALSMVVLGSTFLVRRRRSSQL